MIDLLDRMFSFPRGSHFLYKITIMKPTPLSVVCTAMFCVTLPLLPISLHAQEAAPAAAADPGSSSALTTKAWGALTAKDYDGAIAATKTCIDTFKPQALAMQKALTAAPSDKDATFAQWALNDVGTCLFIQAKAFEGQNKAKEALEDYKFLADNLPFAQCWDTKGWFWKPADAAKERLKALEFDSLK